MSATKPDHHSTLFNKQRKHNLLWLGALILVWVTHFGVVPWLDAYVNMIIVYAGINIILAVSLNLVNGFAGQFSMGHAGFMSIGAYTAAFLSTTLRSSFPAEFADPVLQQVFFIGALIAGGAFASVAGYVVGLPSLRLKGDYLAIVTLGFGEIIRVIILNLDFLGGARGMAAIPSITNFGHTYMFVVFTVFFMWRLAHSEQGRALLALREDEIAAETMGVNTTKAKVRAFVIGAFFAGVAGGYFAHYLTFLTPASFDFNKSFEIIIMVVLGGMGSISGSVVAAIFLTVMKEALRPLQELTHLDFRMVIYSLMLIVLMLLRPNGIFGRREIGDILARWRERFKSKRETPT